MPVRVPTAQGDRISRRSILRATAAVSGTGVVASTVQGTASRVADPAEFDVGVAKVSADPEPPYDGIYLGGYGSDRPMTHVRDTLYTRAVAITGDHPSVAANGDNRPQTPGNGPPAGQTFVLVTLTAVGLFAAYHEEWGGTNGCQSIREHISAATDVPVENVIVQSDHSHAAPDTIGLWGGVPTSYMERLHDAAVEAGVEAVSNREPALLYAARVAGPPLAAEYEHPPASYTDDHFRVLYAESPADGDRILTLANYNPHATVLYSDNEGGASADWPAWAADIAETREGGLGMGVIGAIGVQDWRKDTSLTADQREANARARLRRLYDAAVQQRVPVTDATVDVETRFIQIPASNPLITGANVLSNAGAGQEGFEVYRSTEPPWLTGNVLGTFASAVRVGDVFFGAAPGEMFPEGHRQLRETVDDPSVHFFVGAANDFLGYQVYEYETYQQVTEAFLAQGMGCPEEATSPFGLQYDCDGRWIFLISPSEGRQVICSATAAAASVGFDTTPDADCHGNSASDDPPTRP